jgi:hypothetical protein
LLLLRFIGVVPPLISPGTLGVISSKSIEFLSFFESRYLERTDFDFLSLLIAFLGISKDLSTLKVPEAEATIPWPTNVFFELFDLS